MKNVYALLNPVPGIQSLLGTGSSPQQSRIYPGVAPESAALPLVECHMTTDEPLSTLGGVDDAHRESWQFSIHSLTFTQANAIADAIHDALEGNGYQTSRSGGNYDSSTKTHSVFLDWSFIA
jgi:hypothetical protein